MDPSISGSVSTSFGGGSSASGGELIELEETQQELVTLRSRVGPLEQRVQVLEEENASLMTKLDQLGRLYLVGANKTLPLYFGYSKRCNKS